MLADDESQNPPQSGRFAIKLQSEMQPKRQYCLLLSKPISSNTWRVVKDRIELFFDDKNIGVLRNEYLTISGKTFILTDLTGAM